MCTSPTSSVMHNCLTPRHHQRISFIQLPAWTPNVQLPPQALKCTTALTSTPMYNYCSPGTALNRIHLPHGVSTVYLFPWEPTCTNCRHGHTHIHMCTTALTGSLYNFPHRLSHAQVPPRAQSHVQLPYRHTLFYTVPMALLCTTAPTRALFTSATKGVARGGSRGYGEPPPPQFNVIHY